MGLWNRAAIFVLPSMQAFAAAHRTLKEPKIKSGSRAMARRTFQPAGRNSRTFAAAFGLYAHKFGSLLSSAGACLRRANASASSCRAKGSRVCNFSIIARVNR